MAAELNLTVDGTHLAGWDDFVPETISGREEGISPSTWREKGRLTCGMGLKKKNTGDRA